MARWRVVRSLTTEEAEVVADWCASFDAPPDTIVGDNAVGFYVRNNPLEPVAIVICHYPTDGPDVSVVWLGQPLEQRSQPVLRAELWRAVR